MKQASLCAAFASSCLLLLPAVPTATAAPATQQLLISQSSIRFTSRQMGVPVAGRFKRFELGGNFDPKKPEASAVLINIDLASVDIGNAETERELKKPGWFDAATRPIATFKSSAIRSVGAGRFDVQGLLSIKGQARQVSIPVQLVQKGGQTTAKGALQIQRLDYRIGDGEWNDISIVANEVLINFELTLSGVPSL